MEVHCKRCKTQFDNSFTYGGTIRTKGPSRSFCSVKCSVFESNYKKTRVRTLKWKYGLSEQDYNSLLQSQGYGCAICGGTCHRKLSVDHDHATGRIRGLLCQKCNSGLGMFDDSRDLVLKAVDYLSVDV